MSQKLFAFIILLSCLNGHLLAQNKKTALVKGKLLNSVTKAPFSDIKVSIPTLNVFTTTDGDGNYELSEIPYGTQSLVISAYNAKKQTIEVNVDKDVVVVKDISVVPDDAGASPESNEIPTIALEDNNSASTAEDDGVSQQNAGGLVISNGDPFISTLAYIFGLYRFQPRGYQRNSQDIQVNGVTVNDVETGNASWSQFGGLNDVFRGRDITYGLTPSGYAFGGINGSAYVDATAANQRKGTDVTYTLTDRNYNNRIMFTENTGLMKNGWAFSFSGSRRWAQEGYVPGTSYDGYSYFAAASKVIGKGILSLTTFGSPTYHTKAAAATKEADTLAGTNYYNHNWGLDNGKDRNLASERIYQPITILNYEYRPSDKTRWNTAVSYEFGKDKNGVIDYTNASSPYGDYYKNLPSYYLTMVPPDPTTAAAVRQSILNDPAKLQINWDRLYNDNLLDTGHIFYNKNGMAVTNVHQAQSEYILADNVNSLKKFVFNTNIEHAATEHLTLSGGLTFTSQHTESYAVVTDLLGGAYYVNNNSFATQQSIVSGTNSNNINALSPVVGVGDKVNYDYLIRYYNTMLWGQAVYNYDKFDFYIALNAGNSSFNRDGYMQNGLFPSNSFGNSTTNSFFDYAVKGGVSYKFDRSNLLFINALYSTTPPTSDNTYISSETRDLIVNNPKDQTNKSLEAGYMLRSSKITARVVGYVTDVTNATEIKRFFNDDPTYNTFVNYVMQGENTRSIGTELALSYKLTREVTLTGVATIGQAFYTNNPTISVYLDNDTTRSPGTSKTFIKNYYLAAGPQTAGTIGINYRPRFLRNSYIVLNGNYFDRNYVSINPNRRTTEAAGYTLIGSPQWHAIFDQEKLPSAFTVDLRLGKNFMLSNMSKRINKISHQSVLALSAGISNLLNNTDVINYGTEQLRFDFTNNNPAKFANKYIYGPGINFFLNITLRF